MSVPGVPAVPVIILGALRDIYGQRMVKSNDVLTTPYRMWGLQIISQSVWMWIVCSVVIIQAVACEFRCWMTDSRSAVMAHFIINMGLLAAVVISGIIMLVLVFRKIRHRDEWRRNRVAFLSIWGLSCLFGSTWALAFFSSEASETILFLFCIINSLQGEFLGSFSFPLTPWTKPKGSALRCHCLWGRNFLWRWYQSKMFLLCVYFISCCCLTPPDSIWSLVNVRKPSFSINLIF